LRSNSRNSFGFSLFSVDWGPKNKNVLYLFRLFGREAATFRGNGSWNWVTITIEPNSRRRSLIDPSYPILRRRPGQQLGTNNYGRDGRLFEGKIMVFFGYLGTATTATVGNNNYGREAAAFFEGKIMGLFWTIGRLFEGKVMGLFWTIGNHN